MLSAADQKKRSSCGFFTVFALALLFLGFASFSTGQSQQPKNPVHSSPSTAEEAKSSTQPAQKFEQQTKTGEEVKPSTQPAQDFESCGFPTVFILGGQKCATTSLHSLLMQSGHFQEPCGVKECHVLEPTGSFRKWTASQAGGNPWMSPATRDQCLNKSRRRRIEIDSSVSYLNAPGTAALLYSLVPQGMDPGALRFIVSLRDPVLRMISWINMDLRKCMGPFQKVCSLVRTGNLTKGDLADMAEQYILRCLESVDEDNQCTRGLYTKGLQAWLQKFRRDQILILSFEQLTRNPQHAVNDQIMKFLHLPKMRLPDGLTHKNSAGALKVSLQDLHCSVVRKLWKLYVPDIKLLNHVLNSTHEIAPREQEEVHLSTFHVDAFRYPCRNAA
mmetsp:Transcript_7663/g.19188  ORF Transcript_7663/g.19188 Transcript_7663/m.19188 type:complete len:388 (-) Transcript_7663:266-1429(-)